MSDEAVLKTLIYSDIFDYPLTEEEVYKFLHSNKKRGRKYVSLNLEKNSKVEKRDGFYFLRGKGRIVALREDKAKDNELKIKKAKNISKTISLIPYIKFVGISGSVAVKNAIKNDDIDLFLITEKNKVWLSRLISIVILKILGVHRGRNGGNNANKICLNMIISEDRIVFDQDIYRAREISQMIPIFNRGKCYEHFLKRNIWIKKYLANFEPTPVKGSAAFFLGPFFSLVGIPGEKIARLIQVSYMSEKLGLERVEEDFLAFHPNDVSKIILRKYQAKISRPETTRGH